MTEIVSGMSAVTRADVPRVIVQTLRARRRRRIEQIAYGVGFPLFLLGLWELLVHVGVIDRRFFPPPSKILINTVHLLGNPAERSVLLSDIGATYMRLLIGFG